MRRGASGRSQLALERLEGPGPAVVVRGPLQPVADEGLAGVAADGLQEGRLGPGGDPHRHRATPALGQVGPDGLGVGRHGRHQDLPGDPRGRIGVDVDQEPFDQLAGGQVLDLVDEQGRAGRPPCPTGRGTPGRPPPARPRPGQHVEVLGLGRAPSGARRRPPGRPRACPAGPRPARTRGPPSLAHGRFELRSSGPVSPPRKEMRSATSRSYSSWVTSPTHGPEHRSMWKSRHGRPRRSWFGGTWCPSRSAPGTTAAAGRGCPGWPRRWGRGRSTGPRLRLRPRTTAGRGHSSLTVRASHG
jgi:hypothetical protein